MKGKKIQIKAKSTATASERLCDAYVDDHDHIQLEFKKGKVYTTISLDELQEQLQPLSKKD